MKFPHLLENFKNRRSVFLCFCGNVFETDIYSVRRGSTKSCKCLYSTTDKRFKKHGMEGSPIYKRYHGIKTRCNNPNNKDYKNYGGRGIKICKCWDTFEKFYKCVGDIPKDRTIDRVNNNGNYCKYNFRWATMLEQANNKRRSKR